MANMNNKHCKLFKNDINQSQSDDNDDSQVIDNQSSKVSTELSQEWRKVLYDKQGVPDNFVPKSFLKDLKKNGKVFDSEKCNQLLFFLYIKK